MSERKIVVPEGMGVAVGRALHDRFGSVGDYHPRIPVALKAALAWLSENPIVPTDEWIIEHCTARMAEIPWVKDIFFEWQRRMFFTQGLDNSEAPAESAYMRAARAIGGVTLTREEGERIIEFVLGAIHG